MTKVSVLIRLTSKARTRLRTIAAKTGQTQSAVVEAAVMAAGFGPQKESRGKWR